MRNKAENIWSTWKDDWNEVRVCARLIRSGGAKIMVQEMSDGRVRRYTRLRDQSWKLTTCPECGREDKRDDTEHSAVQGH